MPLISVVIYNHTIHKILLDLGNSVNILPFIVYEILGLRKPIPAKMVLQSPEYPTGLSEEMVEDMLMNERVFL